MEQRGDRGKPVKQVYRIALVTLVSLLTGLFSLQPPAVAAEEAVSAKDAKETLSAQVNRPVGDKWALIFGIGDFADAKIPKLKYASKDAQDFYQYLVKEARFAPDHVRIFLDEKATQRRILSELGSHGLPRLVKPDDLVVIFFSTHGSPSQLDSKGANYIVAYDSDPDDLYVSGVDMKQIFARLKERTEANRIILIMDACHSGSTAAGGKGIVRTGNFDAKALAEGLGQMVICSSQTEERSWESKRYKNGVFTHNLIEGLRTNPGATVSEVFQKICGMVSDEVKEDYAGAEQNPVLHTKWEGSDVRLAAVPSAPRIIPETVSLDLEPDSSALVGKPAKLATKKNANDKNTLVKPGGLAEEFRSTYVGDSKVLTLTQAYFCNESDPRRAYQEACAQQAAHFNEPEYYFRKAKILIQLGNFSKADQELKGLLVDNPNNSAYHLARAYCYHRLGNRIAAEDHLNMAKFHDLTLPKQIVFGD